MIRHALSFFLPLVLLVAPASPAQTEPAGEARRMERLMREIKRLRLRVDLGLPVGEEQGFLDDLLARVLGEEERLPLVLSLMGLAPDASPGRVVEALQESHYAELNRLSELKAEYKRVLERPELAPAAVRRVLEAVKRKWQGRRPELPAPPPVEGLPEPTPKEDKKRVKEAWPRIEGLEIDRRELADRYFAKGRELVEAGGKKGVKTGDDPTPMACFKEARRLYGLLLERRGYDPMLHLRHAQAAVEMGFLLLEAFGDDREGLALIEQAREELVRREAFLPDHLRFHEARYGNDEKRVEEVFHLYKVYRELIDRRLRFRRIVEKLPMPAGGEE